MSSLYSKSIFDRPMTLSDRLRLKFDNVVANDHQCDLDHLMTKFKLLHTDNFNAISSIITKNFPSRSGYNTDFIGTLAEKMSQKAQVYTEPNIQIVTQDAFPEGSWTEQTKELYTESYTGKLAGRSLRIGRFDSWQKRNDIEESHIVDNISYHHPFLGIDTRSAELASIAAPHLLTQLAALNDIVSHDYIHHFSTVAHVDRLGIETINFDDWNSSFGKNNTISGKECWHVLAHKNILDEMHPDGATNYLHQYGMRYLDTLNAFTDSLMHDKNAQIDEIHSVTEYLGLCGVLTYMRVGSINTPEMTSYLERLEEIDPQPELTVQKPLAYSDGFNAQRTLEHYRSNRIFLDSNKDSATYIEHQKAELINFIPIFSYLNAPNLEEKSFLQNIFGNEHEKVHKRVDTKTAELFRGIRLALGSSAPTPGF